MNDERPALGSVEGRVLGVLIEKQMTTPDNYPLTHSAVVAGCNQATNRNPVMSLDEREVEQALVRLHDAGLATPVRRQGDRVTKYRHKAAEFFEVGPPEQAILAVLLLRGPQTAAELRSRTERYVTFSSAEEVETTIDALCQAGLAVRLPRSPGQSQRRIAQTLVDGDAPAAPAEAVAPAASLEARVAEVERRLEALLDRLGVDDI